MKPPDARNLIACLAGRPVLVIGDVMLDHFLFGDVERISPEAPVPVVRFERDEFRLGGAANVAHNIHTLGARPTLLGITGRDPAAERLRAELTTRQIPLDGLVSAADRATTTKVRVVTRRNQQVARIDYETEAPLPDAVELALIERIEREVPRTAVVVISDYLKGAVTRRVAAHAIQAGMNAHIPVLVDPKVPHVDFYAGATLVTPNHHEAEAVTLMRLRTSEDTRIAARRFRDRTRCADVLITRGEQGMWLLEGERDYELPATAREVSDVTGAGDTVIATIASALAADAALADAAWLANCAAGLVVAKFGAAAITPEELIAAVGATA